MRYVTGAVPFRSAVTLTAAYVTSLGVVDITEVAMVVTVAFVRNAVGIVPRLNAGFTNVSKHKHMINTDTKLITLPAII